MQIGPYIFEFYKLVPMNLKKKLYWSHYFKLLQIAFYFSCFEIIFTSFWNFIKIAQQNLRVKIIIIILSKQKMKNEKNSIETFKLSKILIS